MIQIKPEWKVNNFANEDQFQCAAMIEISRLFPQLRGKVWHTKNEGEIKRMPNEGAATYNRRRLIEGNNNKAKGMLAGVMDILLLHNGILYKNELKQPRGVLSSSQLELHSIWNRDCPQIPVAISYTVEDVILWVEKILRNNLRIDFRT